MLRVENNLNEMAYLMFALRYFALFCYDGMVAKPEIQILWPR